MVYFTFSVQVSKQQYYWRKYFFSCGTTFDTVFTGHLKYAKMHILRYRIQNFLGGDTPEPPYREGGRGRPLPDPPPRTASGASRLRPSSDRFAVACWDYNNWCNYPTGTRVPAELPDRVPGYKTTRLRQPYEFVEWAGAPQYHPVSGTKSVRHNEHNVRVTANSSSAVPLISLITKL